MSSETEERTERARTWRACLAVCALTIAAFFVRHTGVRALLPHEGEPHERVYATQVEQMRAGVADPEHDPQFDYYPLLVARLALLTQPAPERAPASVDDLRRAAGDDLAHLRTIIAMLSALAVPATYLLARRFLTRSWSVLAAALYAASPLAILLGQQARPHAAVVGPILAAVLSALLVRRRPVIGSYVAAGLALGFALAILHNSIAVLPALGLAHVLRDREKERRPTVGLGIAIALAAAIALWAYPRDSIAMTASESGDSEQPVGAHFVFLQAFHGQGFLILGRTLRDYEPWLAALAALGLSIWIARRVRARDLRAVRGHEDRLVVAAWCIPYALVIGAYDVTYERFLLPLLPCFALLAAYAAAAVAVRVHARTPAKIAIVAALVLAPQSFAGLRLARAMGSSDTILRCARWIEHDIPPGSARLAVFSTIDLPLLRTNASLHADEGQVLDITRPWLRYQAKLAPESFADQRYELLTVPEHDRASMVRFQNDMRACVDEWHADYVILEVFTPERRARLSELRTHLQQVGQLAARFSPYTEPDDDVPFTFSEGRFGDYGWWTGHMLHACGFGPVVEVYRLH